MVADKLRRIGQSFVDHAESYIGDVYDPLPVQDGGIKFSFVLSSHPTEIKIERIYCLPNE